MQRLNNRQSQAGFKKSLRFGIYAMALSLLVPHYSFGVEDSRLWLPKTKSDLKIKLFRAAQIAEDLPACLEVVSGTLHLKDSTEARPVFKIICRNEERRTYSVLLAGDDYVYLNPPPEPPPPPEPEPEEVVDPVVEKLKREQEFLRVCEAGLQARTKNMLSVEWLYKEPMIPSYSGEDTENQIAKYELPFDARDIQKHPLRFKGICELHSSEDFDDVKIEIKPR